MLLFDTFAIVIGVLGIIFYGIIVVLRSVKNLKSNDSFTATDQFVSDEKYDDFYEDEPFAQKDVTVEEQLYGMKENTGMQRQAPMPKMEPVVEEVTSSDYSLEDPEAAKRAIIYSDILKPKF